MAEYGVEITKLLIENISLPDEVERALDRRSSMGVVGDLRKYAQFQAAEAMRAAAEAPSGGMAAGIGMGAGMAMARRMADAVEAGPPPLTPAIADRATWHVALDGAPRGPVAETALREWIYSGRIDAETLVWRAGDGELARRRGDRRARRAVPTDAGRRCRPPPTRRTDRGRNSLRRIGSEGLRTFKGLSYLATLSDRH